MARRRLRAPTRQPAPPPLKPAAAVRHRDVHQPTRGAQRVPVPLPPASHGPRKASIEPDHRRNHGTAGSPGCGSIRSPAGWPQPVGFRLPPEPGARRRGAQTTFPPEPVGLPGPGRNRVSRPTAKGIPSTPRRDRQPWPRRAAPRPPSRGRKPPHRVSNPPPVSKPPRVSNHVAPSRPAHPRRRSRDSLVGGARAVTRLGGNQSQSRRLNARYSATEVSTVRTALVHTPQLLPYPG